MGKAEFNRRQVLLGLMGLAGAIGAEGKARSQGIGEGLSGEIIGDITASRWREGFPMEPSIFAGKASLRQRAAVKGLFFGVGTGYWGLNEDEDFKALVLRESAVLVPDQELKWLDLRPSPDGFDFTRSDWLVDFALANQMIVRGHTLIWYLAMPDWFEKYVSSENVENLFETHIRTVTQRYAGRMHSWDVVNEAIAPEEGRKDGLRKTAWLNYLEEYYIDHAFRIAAEVDPEALLIYNDYGFEYDTAEDEARRKAVLQLLERLKSRGVPIHGLGVQSHLRSDRRVNPTQLRKFLADVASLDLKIFLTELDVTEGDSPVDLMDRDRVVADAYEDYLSVALDEPAVRAVITWGLSDRYTWLASRDKRLDGSAVRPLPFDDQLNRKLAWGAIARAIDQCPVR